ncbi:MAG: hypothetical protein EWM47_08815 [Anaerolineaceae bacterium]|nr:MAG: hypothetical protein EWM47_08815 [Anaerolineaceae bacterium]
MKRKTMLLKRLSTRSSHRDKRTIGLIGINRGVGVTYTGMLLAYYFGREKGIKTAYLECNNHMDFARLQEAYEWSNEDDTSFSLDKVTYYKQVAKDRIPEILSDDYDCCILDFGNDYKDSIDEFIRCGSKIIIGDSAIWNQSRMESFIKVMENIKGSKHWIHMIPNAKYGLVKKMAHETDRCFLRLPYESDPRSLSKETDKLFHSLFG